MKFKAKKALSASMALLMTTSVCSMLASCNDTPDADETTTLGTMPPVETTTGAITPDETTTASEGSTPAETTTAASTGGTQVEIPVGDYTNPLTGEPTTVNLSGQRPLAIVVDNVPASYANQTGLTEADVLYETLVAPGITRFLMLIADPDSVDAVCNIRSGRAHHLDFAAYHNAVLMAHGGAYNDSYDFYQDAKDRLGSRYGFIDTCQEPHFNQLTNGELYGTIDNEGDRDDLQYDTIYKPAALKALLTSKYSKFTGGFEGNAKQSLKFVEYGTTKSMAGASDATNISLEFTADGAAGAKLVSYKYDAATDKYLRYQDGKAHVDGQSKTGEQLAFTNVITLFTDVDVVKTGIKNDPYMTEIDTVGTGTGYYFYGGKVINITWTATSTNLKLTDALGNELKLATGNTYIGYLDDSYAQQGKFWN